MNAVYYFSSNLKFLRERKGMSQEKLAVEMRITRSQLSAYEKGQTKNPTLEFLMKVSEYFRITLDILVKTDLTTVPELRLREYETRSDRDAAGKELRVIVTTVNVRNKQNIEYVPLKAKAGYLTGYGDPEYISKLPVFNLPHLPPDRKFRMFPAEGDSMYPFPENAMIVGEFVDDWFNLKDNVPCVVVTKNEGIAFKLATQQIPKNRTIRFASLNEVYQPYEVGLEDICEIWKYRCYISNEMPEKEITLEKLNAGMEEVKKGIRKLLGK